MRNLKILNGLLIIILVASCSSMHKSVVLPGTDYDFDPAIHGYIVGSVSFSGNYPSGESTPLDAGKNFRYWTYGFFFKGISKGNESFSGNISSIPPESSLTFDQNSGDYDVPDGLGYVFLMPVRAGDYKFYWYHYKTGGYSYTPIEEFEIQFSISPGKVHYVGEIRYKHQFGKNLFGMAVPNGAKIQFLDSEQRDMQLLNTKFPEIKDYEFTDLGLIWDSDK